ncbi:HET-domain-containing protein [Annulohypoxylon maeteangense]|uniref:HET-domain-containing protein n=1 Tax=Annulohypoxylon maeteangense TaxID=1927788 RepID=UPI0020083D96|nr:HET-domain-containing protein [Annulohypoxylon maeteangense]KAI0889182.1 HET-domain-containing protein [Annulohypoxylon maeteangense]
MEKSGQPTSLCDVCSSINISEYFKEEKYDWIDRSSGWVEADSSAKRLGLLRDICLKAHRCSFCWIVMQSVCTTSLLKETTPEALLKKETVATEPRECYLYSYCFAKNDRIEDESPYSKAIRIGIAYRAGRPSGTGPAIDGQIGDIQLLDEDSMRVRNSRAFFGRRIGPKVDISLANYWLDLCETYHGARCNEQGLGSNNQPKDLLVIDVKQKCIAKLPAGANYLALSYCWPTREMFQTLLENVDELFKPRALTAHWDQLPAVIKDTINFTLDFHETYLWVDALCIVQDDQDQKNAQISQMDRVYASALMTIVPALKTLDPEMACSGLPRYNPKVKVREQKVAIVQGMHLAVPFEAAFGVVDRKTRWGTRAWTYQECLISRRILFLTESQAYFQCRHSVFCEDCRGEIDSTDVYIAPGTNLWNPGALETTGGRLQLGFGTLHLTREPYATDERAIMAYLNYVLDYSFRQSTKASDSLNAFRAIQNVLCDTMQTSFFYGIPEKYLDVALLFIPYIYRPRAEQDKENYPLNLAFPSWTWAAWNCGLENSEYFSCITHGIRREVDWFLVCEGNYAIALESVGAPSKIKFPHANNQELGLLGSVPSGILPPLKTKTSPNENIEDTNSQTLLCCWTMVLDLYLPGRIVPLGSYNKRWSGSVHLAILNDEGKWIGSILMNELWVKAHPDRTRSYRFILISRSEEIIVDRDPDVAFFDTNLFEYRPWCFLNVMMVEESGDTARRLGVGTIHEDAWIQENPTKMLVKLK